MPVSDNAPCLWRRSVGPPTQAATLGFVRDDTGEFVDVNPAWEQARGYSRDQSIGHSLVDLNIYSVQTRTQLKALAQ